MGIPRVLPQRIFLPSSPARAREQSDEKFQPSEIIEHLANDFNERKSDYHHVHVSTAVIGAKISKFATLGGGGPTWTKSAAFSTHWWSFILAPTNRIVP